MSFRSQLVISALLVVALLATTARVTSAAEAQMSLLDLLEQRGVDDAVKKVGKDLLTNNNAFKISKADQDCVICQYLVERVRGEMLINGLGGGLPFTPGAGVGGAPLMNANPMRASPGLVGQRVAAAPQGEAVPAVFLEEALTTERVEAEGVVDTVKGAVTKGVDKLKELVSGPQLYKLRREREVDMIGFRPRQVRFAHLYDGQARSAQRAQQRFENNQMYQVAYQTLEDTCTRRMPKPFYKTCGLLLQQYQSVSEGLRWKDRPDAICMRLEFCGRFSYIQKGPHAVYRNA